MASLSRKTISGFFWLASSSGIQSVLAVLITAILARLLVPSDFGLVASAMVVIVFTEMVYEMGVGPALVQLDTLDESHVNTAFTFSLFFGLVLIFTFWLINPFIASFFEMPDLERVLDALAWIFPFKSVAQVSYSILQRDLQFKRMAGLDILSYLVGYGLVGVSLALLNYGVWALVAANLVQSILYSLLLFYRDEQPKRIRFHFDKLKELLSFGGNFTIAKIFNFLARKGDYLIVGKLLGASALGIYSRAYALMNAPNSIAGKVMGKVLFSSFSKIKQSPEQIRKAVERLYSLLFLFIIPLSGLSFVLAKEIILILLGPNWVEAEYPSRILIIGMVFRVGYKIGGNLMLGLGRSDYYALIQFTYALLVVGGGFIGAKWGIVGVSYAVLFAIMFQFTAFTYMIERKTNFSFFSLLREMIPPLVLLAIFINGINLFVNSIRLQGYPSLLILLLTGAITLLFYVTTISTIPNWVVGRHGMWLIQQIKSRFFNRLKSDKV